MGNAGTYLHGLWALGRRCTVERKFVVRQLEIELNFVDTLTAQTAVSIEHNVERMDRTDKQAIRERNG